MSITIHLFRFLILLMKTWNSYESCSFAMHSYARMQIQFAKSKKRLGKISITPTSNFPVYKELRQLRIKENNSLRRQWAKTILIKEGTDTAAKGYERIHHLPPRANETRHFCFLL